MEPFGRNPRSLVASGEAKAKQSNPGHKLDGTIAPA